MNELELLELLIQNERELQMSLFDIQMAEGESAKQSSYQKKYEIENKIKLIKIELINIPDKTESQKAKYAIIDQLNSYDEQINLARQGVKLTRNQGMILENMLFGNISMDIYRQVSEKTFGLHIPAYLEYTYSDENSIEIPELSEFLKSEVNIVKAIEDADYVKLRNYYNGFRDRVVEKFIN